MHPPLRSVNRETRVGDTRRPTGMKRGDPSVHLPQHAAHSLIRTNKLYGLTVIIVGFSITRTLSKSSHSTVNADVTCATIYWARWLAAVYVSATRGQCCPLVRLAAETSPRACSSKNRKSADFWFQLGVGGAHRFPIYQCFVVWPRKRDFFFSIVKIKVNLPEIVSIDRFEHKQAPPLTLTTLDVPHWKCRNSQIILRKDATSLDMYFFSSHWAHWAQVVGFTSCTEKLAQTQQLGLFCSSSGSREVSSSARDYRKEAMLSG